MRKYITSLFAGLFFVAAATAQIDRSKQPVPGPAPSVNLAVPQSFELDNGLKVLVVRNTKLPRVRVQLRLDNPLYAAEKKAGVESIVAAMLGNGTTSIPKDAFNEEVDFLGASVNFGAQSAFASSLSKYFDRIFELFADALKNPLLTEEEFDKEKQKLLEALKMNERDVSAVSRQVSGALLYGKNHPKGEFATEETVKNVQFSDVQSYYNSFFSPAHAYLVVIGDVEMAKVRALTQMHLSDWTRRTVPNISYSDPKDTPNTQINFIDMPNAVQSEIVMQNVLNLPMSHPDYHAVLMANEILGGGGTQTRLNASLRETYGWTYGAYSAARAGKHVSRFAASVSVRNAVTDSAVTEMLRILNDMRQNPVSAQELQDAKAKFVGDFVRNMEKPETVAGFALNMEVQNLPKDFYETYLKKINAVTVADVQRVAQKYFSINNTRIVVTGKGSEVLDGLKLVQRPDGKALVPVHYYDRFANPTDEPNYNIEMDASVTVASVLEDYLKAIGGKAAANTVQTLSFQAEGAIPGAPAPVTITQKTKADGKYSMELTMMGMSIMKQVVADGKAYMSAQGQRTDMEGDDLDEMLRSAHPVLELLMLKDKTVSLEGIENMDGTDAYALLWGKTKYYYAVDSGLKIAVVTATPQGKSTIYYSNYQTVGGVKFPKNLTVSMGPQAIEFKDADIQVNEGVTDADFE